MKIISALLFFAALAARAQSPGPVNPEAEAKEQAELQQAVGEAGASTVDRIRALELHLKKYPDTKQRAVIEEALAKAAMESNDNARIAEYGEKVIFNAFPPDSNETIILLDRLIRALVDKPDVQRASRARALVRRYETDVRVLRAKNEPPPGHMTAVLWSEELDKAMARALALDARATGYSGDKAAAEKLALLSWEAYPSAEGAREAGYWLSENGNRAQAIEYYADAFTLEDPNSTAADRAADRTRLGELYSQVSGSEKGLGDTILAAYDRTQGLMNARRAAMKAKDPNSQATKISEFTLPAIEKSAAPLALGALRGKTIILDFWATWCAPCRAQKPLIEELEAHYKDSPDVVFVTIDADDDPAVAPGFIKEQGWKDSGYFEAGLARLLAVSSIPTVLVIDPNGRTSSRMIGFIPDRFKDMLAERVEEARAVAKN